MKFFVSSRMSELSVERKAAIEVVHFAGHTPLYIETEPEVRDEAARQTMLSLLSDADCLISMHYLSEGRSDIQILGDHAPIEFELIEFCRLHPGSPVLLFRRTPDRYVRPSERMLDWFDDQALALNSPIITFTSVKDLQVVLSTALRPYKGSGDDVNVSHHVTIRYLGPDFIGLIGKIAEVIFTGYKLNIDNISHATSGEHATVCVTCSPRQLAAMPESIDVKKLRVDLLAAIEQQFLLASTPFVRLAESGSQSGPQVVVDLDQVRPARRQFYLEIRAIDAPGQINAVCSALRELHYNIDELQLKPTPFEYPRQRTMTLSVSRRDSTEQALRQEIDRIEGMLQYLVGVRALSIKTIVDVPESESDDASSSDT